MSAIPADLRSASPWRAALPPFLLLLAAILLAYRETAATMVGIWMRSETFAHAMLVPPIALWLVWRLRGRLAAIAPRPQPLLLAALFAVAALWLAADLVVVDAAAQFALVGMLVLAVPAMLGLQVARAMLFPLLFLFFAVPFGEFVVPTMMKLTADFTVAALQMSGVPVFREGQNFVIPTGHWSVIDECSGVRYLMASFMVGTLFAYLNYRSYRRRAVFMAISLALPVLANWLRAYLIVMMAYLSDNRVAAGVDHVLYGWAFFGVIIGALYFIGARWAEPDDAGRPADATAFGRLAARADAAAPAGPRAWLATAAVGTAIVLLPPLAVLALERSEAAAAAPTLDLPPALAPGWSTAAAALPAFVPQYGHPTVSSSAAYAGSQGAVGVYVAYYRGQAQGSKLVSGNNVLVGMRERDWNHLPGGRRDVAVGTAGRVSVRTDQLLGQAAPGAARRPHLRVWRLYWIDGRWIGGEAAAKIAGAVSRLRGRGDEGAALLLYADQDTPEAGDAVLEAFCRANLGVLDALLEGTRASR